MLPEIHGVFLFFFLSISCISKLQKYSGYAEGTWDCFSAFTFGITTADDCCRAIAWYCCPSLAEWATLVGARDINGFQKSILDFRKSLESWKSNYISLSRAKGENTVLVRIREFSAGKMGHSNTPTIHLFDSLAPRVWLRMLMEKETPPLLSVMKTVFFKIGRASCRERV